MREIIFRGKCKSGKFTYGDYHRLKSDQGMIYMIQDENDLGVEVIPETVGQFVGLKDYNGQCIYEGDIVKWGHIKGSIEITERIAVVEINPDIQFRRINGTGTTPDNSNRIFEYGHFAYRNTSKALEIIGNVHDNPILK